MYTYIHTTFWVANGICKVGGSGDGAWIEIGWDFHIQISSLKMCLGKVYIQCHVVLFSIEEGRSC